jgi:hypothetical protein
VPYHPDVAEPGLWLQFDWGAGPTVDGRGTLLFCAWLVAVSGGATDVGSDLADIVGLPRRDAAGDRRGADVCVHRLCGAPHNRSCVPDRVMWPIAVNLQWRFAGEVRSGT